MLYGWDDVWSGSYELTPKTILCVEGCSMIPDVFTLLRNSCYTGYKNQIKGRFLILQRLLFIELNQSLV